MLGVIPSLNGLTAGPAGAAPAKTTTTTTAPSPTATALASPNGVANPKLTAVVSLSVRRVLATYDRDLYAAALQPSSYVFRSTQAVNLPVTGVSQATNNQAYVLTGAQEPVTYTVKLGGACPPASSRADVDSLALAVAQRSGAEVRDCAHRMKGASRIVGAEQVAVAARTAKPRK